MLSESSERTSGCTPVVALRAGSTAGGCGKSFGDPVDAFEVYEPAADKWRALAPLRAPRSNLSLVLAL